MNGVEMASNTFSANTRNGYLWVLQGTQKENKPVILRVCGDVGCGRANCSRSEKMVGGWPAGTKVPQWSLRPASGPRPGPKPTIFSLREELALPHPTTSTTRNIISFLPSCAYMQQYPSY